MAQLYERRCVVVVDTLRVEDLRMQFSIAKSLKKDPNTCTLKISNLAETTRARMQRKGARVVVSAGYGQDLSVVFSGDARTTDHVVEGASVTTTLQCGDGEAAYQFSRFSESFRPGTSIVTVIESAARALGLDTGNLRAQLAGGGFRGNLTQFAHGYTAHGKASAELDKLLRTVGLSWSVQDGAIQILRGGAPAPGRAVLLTPDSGLVGSPEHGAPDKKGAPSVLKFKALLQPQIRCGGQIEIRSKAIRGFYRVQTLSHEGDTAGGPWYTSGEALPL